MNEAPANGREWQAGQAWPGLVLGVVGLILFTFAPDRDFLPLTLLSILVWMFFPLACSSARLDFAFPLSPRNFAFFLFALQLVVVPLVVVIFGAAKGSIVALPSSLATNWGLGLSILSYASFWIAFHLRTKHQRETREDRRYPSPPRIWGLAILFLAIGFIGFYLFFGDWGQYLSYVSTPTFRDTVKMLAGTLPGAISTFARPFLPFGIVLLWGRMVDRQFWAPDPLFRTLVTAIVMLLLVLSNISFGYNRGAVAAPLLSLVAAYSIHVKRVSFSRLILLAGGGALVGMLWGAYRASAYSVSDLTVQFVLQDLFDKVDINTQIQVYGAAPQFCGYLVEQTGYFSEPYWGKTIISSILLPIPLIGKPFRETSGVALFNSLIYGQQPSADQVIPFQGELFVNFHVFGVLVGFALIGMATARFHRRFLQSRNAFEAYYLFLMSTWVLFLIVGSIAVLSQIFVFMLWPVYGYLVWNALRPAPKLLLRQNRQDG